MINLLMNLTGNGVSWVVYSIGIVLSLLNRNKSPKRYGFALAAFIVLLAESVGSAAARTWLMRGMVQDQDIIQAHSTLNLAGSIALPIWMAGWALLFLSLFLTEAPPPKSRPDSGS